MKYHHWKKLEKNEDKILMMEVSNEIEYVNHHKKKLSIDI